MTDITQNFGWDTPGPGNSPTDNGYKFYVADRNSMDAELFAMMKHHHNGDVLTPADAPAAPTVTLEANGSLFSNSEYHYKISLIDQYGRESTASAEAIVTTGDSVAPPPPPVLVSASTGGTLAGGTYLYLLTYYVGTSNGQETIAGSASAVGLTYATATSAVTVNLPSTIPTGVMGVNIYRRQANGIGFFWLASVNLDVATPPTQYVDDGTVAASPSRILPVQDNTITSTSALVAYPGGTVPTGYTWKIYRTNRVGDWSNSLVHNVIERSSTGGPILASYTDYGGLLGVGSPISNSGNLTLQNPDQVNISTETQGQLPVSRIDGLGGAEYGTWGTTGLTIATGWADLHAEDSTQDVMSYKIDGNKEVEFRGGIATGGYYTNPPTAGGGGYEVPLTIPSTLYPSATKNTTCQLTLVTGTGPLTRMGALSIHADGSMWMYPSFCDPSLLPPAPSNETVVFGFATSSLTAGTWKVSHTSFSDVVLNYNDSAATVQTALETFYGAGNIAVAAATGSDYMFKATFQGTLADQVIASGNQFTMADIDLTPSTSPSITYTDGVADVVGIISFTNTHWATVDVP